MLPLVSVIVVNHNRADLLEDCLESLLGQTWPNIEIIVVDNGSTDRSSEVVRSFGADRIKLIEAGANLGFAAGNNLGFREATGELVALLNNDAVASPEWLQSLVEAMGSPEIGMCASKILLSEGGLIDKAGHLIFPDGQNRGRGTGQRDIGQFDEEEETLFPDGCAALYRRSLLAQLGGFDGDFFAYGDDADLGLRARWLGSRCIYAPRAVVYHLHSATTGPYSPRKIYWVERNRLWLAVKNFPLPLLALNPVFTLYRWMWNLAAAMLGRGAAAGVRTQYSLAELAREMLRAYWDGLRGVPAMWRKRAGVRRRRELGVLEFYRLIWKFRIGARTLAFQDPSNLSREVPERVGEERGRGGTGC